MADALIAAIDPPRTQTRETRQVTVELSLPAVATSRYSNLSLKEAENGGRVIGGDQADLRFSGYYIDGDRTVLTSPVLIRGDFDCWEDDDVNNVANSILSAAFASIGIECIEHS